MKKNLIVFSLIALVVSVLAPLSFNTQAANSSSANISTIPEDSENSPENNTDIDGPGPVRNPNVSDAPAFSENTPANNTESDGIDAVVIPSLIITKTANTAYTRTWNWEIEKTADTSALGSVNASDVKTVKYTITPKPVAQDNNYKVFGTITITNPNPNKATISSIVDQMNSTGIISIDCGVTFPYDLGPNSSMNCSYVSDSSLNDTTNKVTVTTSGVIQGGSTTVDIIWGQPDKVRDKCITITDSHLNGPQGAVYCIDGQKVKLNYDLTFSKDVTADVPLTCGDNRFINTVDFVTNNTKTTGSANWTVTANINCSSNGGGGSGGGSGGGGGFIPTPPSTPPVTPPVTPPADQGVLGEQVFSDGTPAQQVLGEQVVAGPTIVPSFPKTGFAPEANTSSYILAYFIAAFSLMTLSFMAYSQKKKLLSSK